MVAFRCMNPLKPLCVCAMMLSLIALISNTWKSWCRQSREVVVIHTVGESCEALGGRCAGKVQERIGYHRKRCVCVTKGVCVNL